MDAIFGLKNFKNEIVWHYQTGGASKRWFAKKHDIILWYSLNENYYFNNENIKMPRTEKSLKRAENPNGARISGDNPDKLPMDVWGDINALNPMSKERLGYPTQKPIALLNRIITASCPSDGLVFDPFCGCGTTIAAAYQNNVQWIGCDISVKATDLIKKRLNDMGVGLTGFKTATVQPQTLEEYETLTALEKQDFLVRACGGMPNPRKSGDRGIDGDLKIYMGVDENKQDREGRVIYSVKTGKQKGPAMVRELIGTVDGHKATMGILLLDEKPTPEMLLAAKNAGQVEYKFDQNTLPQYFNKINIVTAQQLIKYEIDLKQLLPPDFYYIKIFKDQQHSLSL
jgi:site-specific DNA-methyltransferase (adenine-specific)